jgi:SAM-dependent methyltransferase
MEWGAGRYELIADQLRPAAVATVDAAGELDGKTVVDVGCGTGNAALLAAEGGAKVTGVDPAQRLLDVASADAARRGLDATFVPGKASWIPLPDASMDVVLSVFGAIFDPDPKAAAAEMARVRAPKGRILLANWKPGGPISDAIRFARQTMAEIQGEPPPSTPFPWHEADALSELFEPYGLTASLTEHPLPFHAPSVDEFMRIEGENHPVAIAARPILEEAGRAEEVRDGMRGIYEEGNEDPEAFRVTSYYVVADIAP